MTVLPALGEADVATGPVADAYAQLLDGMRPRGLERLSAAMAAGVARTAMTHGAGEDNHPLPFDPVPRMVDAGEWRSLCAGLIQRARALEAFVADAHGPREAVRAGVVPADAVDTCPWYERDLVGAPAPALRIGIGGPDVVRDGHGRLVVLEDNVRTPTMLGYAAVGRALVREALGPLAPVPPVEAAVRAGMRRVLAAAAPWTDAPRMAILGDGAANSVAWELDALGAIVGLPVLEPHQVRMSERRLVSRATGERIDVLWRRTSEERLRTDAGGLSPLGELLLAPLQAGTLAVVNAFGTGVADDKRILAYVGDLILFHLGEEPLLASARTWDLGAPEARAEAFERLDGLVVKPRDGAGGAGVLVVALSTHPTVAGGDFEPRHVDLRPYVVGDGSGFEVLPVAFCRFAPAPGELVVNCSRGGGGKDVWIGVPELPAGPAQRVARGARAFRRCHGGPASPTAPRQPGNSPAPAADSAPSATARNRLVPSHCRPAGRRPVASKGPSAP